MDQRWKSFVQLGSKYVELVDEGEGVRRKFGLVEHGRGIRREVWASEIKLIWLCLILKDSSSGYEKVFSRSYGGFIRRLKVNRLFF